MTNEAVEEIQKVVNIIASRSTTHNGFPPYYDKINATHLEAVLKQQEQLIENEHKANV